jgi:bifunctional hydroxylase/dehydrase
VITNTLAQRILYLSGEEIEPLRDLFTELLTYPAVQRHLAGMVTGQDIRYDLGDQDQHPLIGRRLRDQELIFWRGGKGMLFQKLHTGRAVLLDQTGNQDIRNAAEHWQDVVDVLGATVPGPCALAGLDAVLVRPDGYVAWVSTDDAGATGLAEALVRWFGRPSTIAHQQQAS